MSINEKANNYLKQLSDITTSFSKYIVRPDEAKQKDRIIQGLEELIKANRDYILTPCFMFYLIFTDVDMESLANKLPLFINDDYLYSSMIEYFKLVSFNKNVGLFNNLNDYEEALFDSYSSCIKLTYNDDSLSLMEYTLLKPIFQIIAAYIIANREPIENFDKYTSPYLNDWNLKVDELRLQGMFEERTHNSAVFSITYSNDKLAKYVISKINDERKEIR